MRPETAKNLLVKAIYRYCRKDDKSLLISKRNLQGMYKLLYRSMRLEGMSVKKINGEVDVSDIQEEFLFMFDIDVKTLCKEDLMYYSDRFYNNPYRLYKMYMQIINNLEYV